MCEPTSVAMGVGLALSAASAAVGYQETKKNAQIQEDQIKQGYELQSQQLMDRYDQINGNASDQISDRAREARVELARLKVLGAESGIAGNSQAQIERESQFLAGSDMATIEANRSNALKQAQMEGKANALDTAARYSSIKRPSLIGSGLQIADAGVSALQRKQMLDQQEKNIRG